MVNPLLIFLVLLNAYILTLFLLHRKGILGPGKRFEIVFGFLLMWRTEQGKQLIDRLSRARRFWKGFGDVGVGVAVVIGILVFLLLLLQTWLVFAETDVVRRAAPSPEYFLVLPGINPIIPVGYGILALAVALIVHEGAHGVLARAHNIKVKSLGLLFAIVPIGAFVEPDDEEMEKESTRAKNRVFSAGIMMNLSVALLCALVFSIAFWGSVHPAADGLALVTVADGLGAEQGGVQEGMILQSLDGQPVRDLATFNRLLNGTSAGDSVQLGLWWQGSTVTRSVQLTDKYTYYEQNAPDLNQEAFRGVGFMGVTAQSMEAFRSIRDLTTAPLDAGLLGLSFYLSLPFSGLNPMPDTFQQLYVVQGPMAAMPESLFWMVANSFYWVFWLNFMVGSFNALPLPILDGGQMFRTSVKAILRRRVGVTRDQLVVERPLEGQPVMVRGRDELIQAKMDRVDFVTRRITLVVGLVLFGMILLPIVGPYFL